MTRKDLTKKPDQEHFTHRMAETAEEVIALINAKGEEVKVFKAANPGIAKDDATLSGLISDLLSLKAQYKQVSGVDFKAPEPEKKKKEIVVQEKKSDGPSKTDLNKEKKKAQKAAAKARDAAAAGEGADTPTEAVKSLSLDEVKIVDDSAFSHFFGDMPLIQSQVMTDKVYYEIGDLNDTLVGQHIWIRGRVATTRAVGKGIFILMRSTVNSVQSVMFQSELIPKQMVKYASGISLESIIDILAEVTVPQEAIQSATIKNLELSIKEIHLVSRAQELPFQVEDAGRNEAEAAESGLPTVSQDTSLNFRWIDTRTPASQAIFRIQSGVCLLFREFFHKRNFVEIHTPKLISGASEGGANVFKLDYFGSPACLCQSPQFYKQMAAACGGFERVFEIGPVFRAEDSNTNRHLCEFTGLDFEMCIIEHYYEVMEVLGDLFTFMFDGIAERYQHELMLVSQQFPFEPIKYLRPSLRITFQEGIAMLREAGFDAPPDEDISTPHEKALGKLVKEKYGTDFYMMDKYPLSVRPFYTMPNPEDPTLSNSYDIFIRGEEIVSGAQRIHDYDMLVERANVWKIPIDSIKGYVDAFKHGVLPHGGGGIGMERVVMLYLGLKNIRKSSMFPRDPNRLAP